MLASSRRGSNAGTNGSRAPLRTASSKRHCGAPAKRSMGLRSGNSDITCFPRASRKSEEIRDSAGRIACRRTSAARASPACPQRQLEPLHGLAPPRPREAPRPPPASSHVPGAGNGAAGRVPVYADGTPACRPNNIASLPGTAHHALAGQDSSVSPPPAGEGPRVTPFAVKVRSGWAPLGARASCPLEHTGGASGPHAGRRPALSGKPSPRYRPFHAAGWPSPAMRARDDNSGGC